MEKRNLSGKTILKLIGGAFGSGLFGILPLCGYYREFSEYAQSRTCHAFWRPEKLGIWRDVGCDDFCLLYHFCSKMT